MAEGIGKALAEAKEEMKGQKLVVDPGTGPAGRKAIHPAHENFNMVFNIMLGIKKAVDCASDIPLARLTPKDFKLKNRFDIAA